MPTDSSQARASDLVVSTVNVNGVRAAVKKGLIEWLSDTRAAVVCLQETRADDKQLKTALAPALDEGWELNSAEPAAKGRNGVAILSRTAPENVRIGFGDNEFADSGRHIEADFAYNGDTLTVSSLYLPSGEANTPKQEEKDRFLEIFGQYLADQAAADRLMVVCGDWNIAHTEADIKNWKGNLKSSGFLPHEREWLTSVFGDDAPWTDVVRSLHPGVDGPYSWWSYRGKAFDNDAGWRIDYQVATATLAERATSAAVERAQSYDTRWSDHAPVTVHYA
ncbi:exodeoxyribonuclease III [Hoyosella rhizosphaerae]|uniref:Exodeoxyribonuclease n=1 Tax=Hoyosella rhizosphaerae TaxID=1755582 RepID=A0A916XEA9_9ACTN|nr:exodeoxyribonuclease III [Hoyosella rhizosphaerae]MBN4926103.1 exodeoxyribonuclease III [Hoyosella rhizosphaerae]GGC65574.1 putative exodeoxyribonuclease [Hoyosella rhizosphaerae]